MSIPLLVAGYGRPPIYCFDQADCDNPACPPGLVCLDDQPGCNVGCKGSGDYCPTDSACLPYSGVETERCGYAPINPSCNISASPSSIIQGQSSTLTRSSDAQTCNASGGWSGSKSISGSEVVFPAYATVSHFIKTIFSPRKIYLTKRFNKPNNRTSHLLNSNPNYNIFLHITN